MTTTVDKAASNGHSPADDPIVVCCYYDPDADFLVNDERNLVFGIKFPGCGTVSVEFDKPFTDPVDAFWGAYATLTQLRSRISRWQADMLQMFGTIHAMNGVTPDCGSDDATA